MHTNAVLRKSHEWPANRFTRRHSKTGLSGGWKRALHACQPLANFRSVTAVRGRPEQQAACVFCSRTIFKRDPIPGARGADFAVESREARPMGRFPRFETVPVIRCYRQLCGFSPKVSGGILRTALHQTFIETLTVNPKIKCDSSFRPSGLLLTNKYEIISKHQYPYTNATWQNCFFMFIIFLFWH